MNCFCNPPKVAIIRKTTKEGKNFGKEFFSCPSSSCNFFSWVQNPNGMSSINSSMNKFIHKNPQSYPSSFNSSTSNTSTSLTSKLVINVSVYSIDFLQNTITIFFSLSSSYSSELFNYLTQLSTNNKIDCYYNVKKKLWIINYILYNNLIQFINKNLTNFHLDSLPVFLINGFNLYIKRIEKLYENKQKNIKIKDNNEKDDIDVNLTEYMRSILLPFQLDGIKFIIKRGGRGLLGDDMGCGKTIQAIALLQHYRNHWPALIVAPVNLLKQWYDEILSYSNDIIEEEEICWIRKANDKIFGKIVLIPYSIMDKIEKLKKISPQQFGLVILDESHHIKTPEAKRTLGIVPFLKNAEVAICMTGTPLLNRPVEIFTQLNGLLPTLFSSYDQFVRRYCDAKPSKFGTHQLDVKGSSNLSELKMILDNLVMIRRLKSDVIKNLPTKCREILYVDPDEKYQGEILKIQKRSSVLDSQLKEIRKEGGAKYTKLTQEKDQLLLQYYQITGMSKLKAIKEEINKLIKSASLNKISLSNLDDLLPSNQSTSSVSQKSVENIEKDSENNIISREVICKSSASSFIEKFYSQKNDKTTKLNDIGIVGDPIIMDLEDDIILLESDSGKDEKTEKQEPLDLVDSDEEVTQKSNFKRLNRNSIDNTQTSDSSIFKTVSVNKFNGYETSDGSEDDLYEDNEIYEEEIDEIDDDIEDFIVDNDDEEDDENEEDGDNRKKKRKKISKVKTKNLSNKDLNDGVIHFSQSEQITLDYKILIFGHHHIVLNSIEKILIESGLGFIRIDGKTNGKKKINLLKEFKENPKISVALLSITACGTGLNLTVAKTAIFAELYWSPGVVLQAEDRIYRIGQKAKEVKICYLLARNTADDIVWENIKKKYSILGETIGNTGELNKIGNNSNSNNFNSAPKSTQQSLNTFLKLSEPVNTTDSTKISFSNEEEDNSALDFDPDEFIANNLKNQSLNKVNQVTPPSIENCNSSNNIKNNVSNFSLPKLDTNIGTIYDSLSPINSQHIESINTTNSISSASIDIPLEISSAFSANSSLVTSNNQLINNYPSQNLYPPKNSINNNYLQSNISINFQSSGYPPRISNNPPNINNNKYPSNNSCLNFNRPYDSTSYPPANSIIHQETKVSFTSQELAQIEKNRLAALEKVAKLKRQQSQVPTMMPPSLNQSTNNCINCSNNNYVDKIKNSSLPPAPQFNNNNSNNNEINTLVQYPPASHINSLSIVTNPSSSIDLKVNESFKNFSTGKGQSVSVNNSEAIENANKIFNNFPYK